VNASSTRLLSRAAPWLAVLLSAFLLAPGARPAPPAKAAPVPSNRIGIVDGIPILDEEWDRLAKPYYEEVEARAGRPITDEEKRLLKRNVLDELIRERLWLADARRRGMHASEAAVDARMKQSAFFKTDGKLDEAKFEAFKHSTTSNYPEIHAEVERALTLEEYSRWMERRFGPREGDLRKAFEERTSLATIRYFVLGPDAISLEPQATALQIRQYYADHPEEFTTPGEARIEYVRFSTAPEAAGDSAKDAALQAARRSAFDFISGLKAGSPAEAIAKKFGGVHESGWFRLGDPIRGLGRSETLTTAVQDGPLGQWLPEPIRVGPLLVLVHIEDRRAMRRLPLADVELQAKRKTDNALREAELDSLARQEVRDHPQVYAVPRIVASLVLRPMESFPSGKPPSSKDVKKALDRVGRQAGVSDTATAWMDSVRAELPAQIEATRRLESAMKTMRDAAKRLRKGDAAERVAANARGEAARMSAYRGEPPTAPRLIEGLLLDSLYTLRRGTVVGPTVVRDTIFVVRVDSADLRFTPPFEAVRADAREVVLDAKRAALEAEAEQYFLSHRDDYLTPTRWTFEYVFFQRAKPESVAVPQDSIVAYYRAHPLEFTEPGRAQVRHILIAFRASDGPPAREAARKKALTARKRILSGEDFGAVAKAMSDDPTTAGKGGELGDVTRGTVVKEFGDAAFTLPIGQLSDPVETQYGFHIMEVESRKPQRLRPLEECEKEIRGVLATAYADSSAESAAESFDRAASAPGADFDSLASTVGGARRSPPLSAGEPLGDLGKIPAMPRVIGSLPDGGVTPQAIAMDNGYLVAKKEAELLPAPATFAQAKERVVADYQDQRRRAAADSLNLRYTPAVQAGASLDSLFLPFGGLRTSKQFTRPGPIPDLVRDPALARDSTYLAKVFSSRRGAVLPPLKGSMGTLYSEVDSLSILPASEFSKRREALLHEVIDERVEAWTERLRSRAEIQIDRKDIAALLEPG
jgi:parvulin-like peptidyl-prolyl isomerase